MDYQKLVHEIVARAGETDFGLGDRVQSLRILDTASKESPDMAALVMVSAYHGKYDMVSLLQVCVEMIEEAREGKKAAPAEDNQRDGSDAVGLRLTVDVVYDLGKTGHGELERVLVNAAELLYDQGLLSGDTEASVVRWNCGVGRIPEGERP